MAAPGIGMTLDRDIVGRIEKGHVDGAWAKRCIADGVLEYSPRAILEERVSDPDLDRVTSYYVGLGGFPPWPGTRPISFMPS